MPGKSFPETCGVPLEVSFLVAVGFVAKSLEPVLWGIFRISLYLAGCLMCALAMVNYEALANNYDGGAGFVPSFRSVMISISCS